MPNVTLEGVWNVLKWVLVVLAAGFIGQFGRSFALKLIERRRRKKTDSDSASSPHPLAAHTEIEKSRLEAQAKIEKKRAKAKRAKKADTGQSSVDDSEQSG